MSFENIYIILVCPQMGENIGSAARLMKNFSISNLRIVSPRDGWPNLKAHEMSAGAKDIIQSAQIFENLSDAIADLNMVYASTSARRDMHKPISTPRAAAEEISQNLNSNASQKIGIMFGRESTGLNNQEISYSNSIIEIPADDQYPSLNLALAVGLISYEIFQSKISPNTNPNTNNSTNLPLASKADVENMLTLLFDKLDSIKFSSVPEKKKTMEINIRNIFAKNNYTAQEIQTLNGIFSALYLWDKRK